MLQKGNFWRRINFVQENMNVEDVFKEYITSFLWLTPILQIKRRQTWIMIWNEFDEFIVQHFYYNLTLGNPPQLIASRIRHLSIETRKIQRYMRREHFTVLTIQKFIVFTFQASRVGSAVDRITTSFKLNSQAYE